MKEIFREVKDFKDYYVSNYGQVKFVRRLKSGKFSERYLTIDPNKMCVRLKRSDNSYRTIKVSILVAETFLKDPRKGRKTVVHLDGDNRNCRWDNLQWEGVSEDQVHEIRALLNKGQSIGEVSRKYNLNRTHVRRIKEYEVWASV